MAALVAALESHGDGQAEPSHGIAVSRRPSSPNSSSMNGSEKSLETMLMTPAAFGPTPQARGLPKACFAQAEAPTATTGPSQLLGPTPLVVGVGSVFTFPLQGRTFLQRLTPPPRPHRLSSGFPQSDHHESPANCHSSGPSPAQDLTSHVAPCFAEPRNWSRHFALWHSRSARGS